MTFHGSERRADGDRKRATGPRSPKHHRVAGIACLFGITSGLGACDNDYPIAATVCDDFCQATERADCDDDRPHECVQDCEADSIARRVPRCEPEWLELLACYESSASDDFYCQDEHSYPREGLCHDQRLNTSYCVSESVGMCVEDCLARATHCGHSSKDCEWSCQNSIPGCASQEHAWYACLLEIEVVCDTTGSDAEAALAPCLGALDALLTCAKFDPSGAGEQGLVRE